MHHPVIHREPERSTATVAVPVAEDAVDVDDGALLLVGEGAALEVRPEVVDPPEPAALAAPLQPCSTDFARTRRRASGSEMNKSNIIPLRWMLWIEER
jgi:hypothetical protein